MNSAAFHMASLPPFHVEHLLQQGSGRFNEDRVLVTPNLFGVFDGASSLVSRYYDDKSGAWWAAELACQEFAGGQDEDLLGLAKLANERIGEAMERHAVDPADKLQCWSTSAAVFRLRAGLLEWVQTGDCLILAIDDHGRHELLTPYHNHDAETFAHWWLQPDESLEQALERLRPVIERVRLGMNRHYGVLSGAPEAEAFLHHGRTPLQGLRHVLAFSDGFFPPESRGGELDFSRLVALYLDHGLEAVAQWVRLLEGRDPQCRLYPRFKCHDDMSAVAVTFC
ncbi:MAG: protein phosphatase 2C domain-containing protein [Desulfuromonadaceae bacterium]|nr:protein phosphatase 2C domain-containing protein [Desulfuromonadaceae bacterium]